jgi:hypothetical protein
VPDRRSVKASDLTPVLGHIEGVKRPLLVLSAQLALAFSGLSCGPSFQAIYEGNSHFEHCYALEENPQTPMRDKSECWRDWSEHYTYGQTRDRVQYAIARYVALSQAPNVPTDEALMNAAPGVTPRLREQTINAPTPTNAFAPPPKVLERTDAGAPGPIHPSELPQVASASAPLPPALPAAGCGEVCGGTFRSCRASCAPDASAGNGEADKRKKNDPCRACDVSYRGCMRSCFK